MKVIYLGTGAAEGIPALFCNCEFCRSARARGILRTRSQILLDGELSIDFPPDAFYHSARGKADFSAIKYLLVSHAHMDHFYASDFILRGYKYAKDMREEELFVFAPEEACEVFCEDTRREIRAEIAEKIRLYVVNAFEEVRFGEWRIFPMKAKHSSKEPLVFLIEKGGKRILHLYDTGLLPEEDYEYLARIGGEPVDLVNLDCTFLRARADAAARHMGIYENAEVLARLQELGLSDGHTKKVITHFSHNAAPTEETLKEVEKEFGVLAAYDGMELVI